MQKRSLGTGHYCNFFTKLFYYKTVEKDAWKNIVDAVHESYFSILFLQKL